MKNKKQILKISCALICIGSMACIIPACVVSCGSSTSSPSSSINSNNSSTTNSSSNQRTSNDDFIDANVNQNATQVLWSNTNLNAELNENSLNSLVSVWKLPKKAINYNISLSSANYQSYQWYQIPFSVFF